jgi:hypothetical protein
MDASSTQVEQIRKALAAVTAHQRRAEALLKESAKLARQSDKRLRKLGSTPKRAIRSRRKGGKEKP